MSEHPVSIPRWGLCPLDAHAHRGVPQLPRVRASREWAPAQADGSERRDACPILVFRGTVVPLHWRGQARSVAFIYEDGVLRAINSQPCASSR